MSSSSLGAHPPLDSSCSRSSCRHRLVAIVSKLLTLDNGEFLDGSRTTVSLNDFNTLDVINNLRGDRIHILHSIGGTGEVIASSNVKTAMILWMIILIMEQFLIIIHLWITICLPPVSNDVVNPNPPSSKLPTISFQSPIPSHPPPVLSLSSPIESDSLPPSHSLSILTSGSHSPHSSLRPRAVHDGASSPATVFLGD
ncbi:hypothetical protein Ahy_A07g031577 isoform B [Arachis hypogaea]|uniref:Uncharacterized protein n=1 Tax=Arachis hypogaea TaxID=3818 RepID=A0A445C4E6_ARAHY|nr:hypothetical protein Ahy_A07g031577 isoform B [Arachis hypogaea]